MSLMNFPQLCLDWFLCADFAVSSFPFFHTELCCFRSCFFHSSISESKRERRRVVGGAIAEESSNGLHRFVSKISINFT